MTANGQRGAVLLAVVLLVAVAAAMSAVLMQRTWSTAAELRARRDVLCARYAALGGLALGAPGSSLAGLVDPRIGSLVVTRTKLRPSWCVLRAAATCGSASRTLDRTLPDALACNVVAP